VCKAAIKVDEITATNSSTAMVCSVGGMESSEWMIVGRVTWMNIGSNGGERGERGMLRMNVAIRLGASSSPTVTATRSSAHSEVKNFEAVESSIHRSTSTEGAFPVRAEARAFWIERRE